MVYKKIIAGVLVSCCSYFNVQAQYFCGTDEHHHQLKNAHPEIVETERRLEAEIQEGMKRLDWAQLAKTTSNDTIHYDVPIVIHIIHDYGVEYLSDDEIFEAVSNWTEVFLARNQDTASVIPPFKPYIGNARIRFRLATKDPDGNPTKGITRRHSYLTHNAGDQAKLDGWPNNSYINLWFINQFSGSHSGAAAYAYYPSSAASIPHYDGIIGLYSYLNYDKVIPHELGHVLNLQHVWGNTNQPDVACGDDQVADTPPTKGHLPNQGCSPAALYDTTCATNYFVVTPTGIIDYPDTTNSQNIMDYTYCYRMFTKGQVTRMRQALTSSVAGRNNLFSAANLAVTGALEPRPDLPPIADFSVERPLGGNEKSYFLCAGHTTRFVFRNRSWNDTITGVTWSFSNDPEVPASTVMQSLANQFQTPGWVSVSITATGNGSGSTTYTDDHAVYAADPTAVSPAGFLNQFGSLADIERWPVFNYYKNTFKWEWFGNAGYQGNGCMRYRSYDTRTAEEQRTGSPAGDYDDLITQAFDLSAYTGSAPLNVNFMTSGSYRGSAPADSMQILVSTDCGRVWRRISSLAGTNLINRAAQQTEFVPSTASQWRAQTIPIPEAYRQERVFVKLRYFPSRTGNNLYLDNFSITPFPTEVREVALDPGTVSVFPNPAKEEVNLAFSTGADGNVHYTVKDLTGKTVFTRRATYAPGTVVREKLPREGFPAPGVYFVSVTIARQTVTAKVVIQ